MAKKKGLAAVAKRRRARKARSNPGLAKDFTHFILPAFGSYAATRLLSRIVYSIVAKKWPRLSPHAGALAALTSFGGLWFAGHKIKRLAPFHDALVVGSGVAALATVVRTYVPKYGWIVADPKPEDYALAPAAIPAALPGAQEPAGAVDEFDMFEAELGERMYMPPPKSVSKPVTVPPSHVVQDPNPEDDLSDLMGDDDGGADVLDMSIYQQGNFENN